MVVTLVASMVASMVVLTASSKVEKRVVYLVDGLVVPLVP